METGPFILAGETIPELSEKKTRIDNATNTLNFSGKSKTYSAAKTGHLVLSKLKNSGKTHVDVSVSSTESNLFFPKHNDVVIGQVTAKNFEQYTLDIGAACPAVLSSIDFEGATRKLKPAINVGDIVYARVKQAVNKFYKPVLTCIHPTCKKGWNSGESYFGPLKGGFLVDAS